MKVRDKVSYIDYEAYKVEVGGTISLELNQFLDIEPNDIIISAHELKGYLVLDPEMFIKRI